MESCPSYQLATQERFHVPCGSTRRTLSVLHSIQERAPVTVVEYQHVGLELVARTRRKMKIPSLPQQHLLRQILHQSRKNISMHLRLNRMYLSMRNIKMHQNLLKGHPTLAHTTRAPPPPFYPKGGEGGFLLRRQEDRRRPHSLRAEGGSPGRHGRWMEA
jgi:hypothetical protein